MSGVVKFVFPNNRLKLTIRLARHVQDVHTYIQINHYSSFCDTGPSCDCSARCQRLQRAISDEDL